jgi:outer membrane protein assembly factor BamB
MAAAAAACASAGANDWPMFGYSPSRTNSAPGSAAITAGNVGHLRRQQVRIPGTVDASPIYLHGVNAGGKTRNVLFVTTTYGITLAIDAGNGKIIWRYTPPSYANLAGSSQITNMTPVADPSRAAIYAGDPGGFIRKLSVSNGKVLWATSITRNPAHEKLASALNFAGGHVLAATDGYIGDAPPYQGHVVALDPSSGRITAVWNSLCSDRHQIIDPSTCSAQLSAIWGRTAPVVDPATGDLLVATGNGPFDGKTSWGDSVLVLSPDAKRLLKHWTPTDQAELDSADLDLGSTAPALLSGGYFVQGGKDGKLRLLRLSSLAGVNGKLGGELQTVSVPGPTDLLSEPATWKGKWVFLATPDGTAAWRFSGGRLREAWSNDTAGTSPVVVGGLVYVQWNGEIVVYRATTGKVAGRLPIGEAHWQSPIVVDGIVAAAEGNANEHLTSGVLDIYRAS